MEGFGAVQILFHEFTAHKAAGSLVKESFSLFVQAVVERALDQFLIQFFRLKALQDGQGLTTDPIHLFVFSVPHDDEGKQDTHHAQKHKKEALPPRGGNRISQGDGEQKGAQRQIDRDDLVPLALLEGQLRMGVLVDVLQIVIPLVLDHIPTDFLPPLQQVLFLLRGGFLFLFTLAHILTPYTVCTSYAFPRGSAFCRNCPGDLHRSARWPW